MADAELARLGTLLELAEQVERAERRTRRVSMAAEVQRPRSRRQPSLHFVRLRRTVTPVPPQGWKGKLQVILQSNYCDVITGVVIVVDLILTCIDIDLRAAGVDTPLWIELCSGACLALYMTELVAVIIVKQKEFLQEAWYLLDTFIVLSGLVQLCLGFAGISLDSFAVLRTLRVVRIMRLFRLFRKFAMLKELRKLVKMTASCFKTLCWSFLFCFVVMTSWAMLAVELLNPLMPRLASEGLFGGCDFCSRSMQSVMSANLLIYKTVVAGDSWGQVAVPLIERHPWATGIFIGSHLSIVFGILNLVVAVVVDTFAEQRGKDVTSMAEEMDEDAEEELRELDKIFAKMDGDGDGNLSWDELVGGAKKVREFQHRLRVMDIDYTDLEQLFKMLDHNTDGTVDPEEFKKTLARWAFDSKTATRFVRYTLQQLMTDHSSAAEKLSKMEAFLQGAVEDGLPRTPRASRASRGSRRRKLKKHRRAGSADTGGTGGASAPSGLSAGSGGSGASGASGASGVSGGSAGSNASSAVSDADATLGAPQQQRQLDA
ncbi:unnamed protein product [Effrenium voratum]|nr:unnamed protein product [Effrenium voratum]